MQRRIILRTNELSFVMGYEFLRIETPMTKLSMNRANQRRTDIFIARAGRITPGFPFHISEWALALRAGAIFV